jgi:hypothetical protein
MVLPNILPSFPIFPSLRYSSYPIMGHFFNFHLPLPKTNKGLQLGFEVRAMEPFLLQLGFWNLAYSVIPDPKRQITFLIIYSSSPTLLPTIVLLLIFLGKILLLIIFFFGKILLLIFKRKKNTKIIPLPLSQNQTYPSSFNVSTLKIF